MATLHHCSIRSSRAVEGLLVRTLNSVCAVLCNQPSDQPTDTLDGETAPNGYSDHKINGGEGANGDNLLLFRHLCMGLMDAQAVRSKHTSMEDLKDKYAEDWTLSSDQLRPPSVDKCPDSPNLQCLNSWPGTDKPSSIDSILDLLVSFVYREGDLGWQARDALLLVATYSLKDDAFSAGIAQNSSVCPVLATGLATLYAELPRRLVDSNLPDSWPDLIHTLDEQENSSPQFAKFLDALDFCQSMLEVAHPLIQASLLHYIHSGFFVSVLGFALTRPDVEDVITATVYLKQLLVHTAQSSLLPTLLRFLLSRMPEDRPVPLSFHKDHDEPSVMENGNAAEESSRNTSNAHDLEADEQGDSVSYNSVSTDQTFLNSGSSSSPPPTYMDLLISRLHYCNTLLGVATLSLFNTILNINCEDVMLYLVLRYLVPFRDALMSLGWSWPEADTFSKASGEFLKLISDRRYGAKHSPGSVNPNRSPLRSSVAELNLDEEPEQDMADPEWSVIGFNNSNQPGQPYPVNGFSKRKSDSRTQVTVVRPNSTSSCTMEALNCDLSISPVMNGTKEILSPTHDKTTRSMFGFAKTPFRVRESRLAQRRRMSVNLTPDDWLNYTSWAKDAVGLRAQACSSWRLIFDATYPEASQVASFENQLKQANAAENMDLFPMDRIDVYDHGYNSDLALLHSRFKCFTINPNTSVNAKRKAGELKARAIRLTVDKLDVQTDLDVEAPSVVAEDPAGTYSRESSLLQNQRHDEPRRSEESASLTTASSTNQNHPNSNDAGKQTTSSSPVDIEQSSLDEVAPPDNIQFPTDQDKPDILKNGHMESVKMSMPVSSSEHQISELPKQDPKKIKSWYCLNYLDLDVSELTTESANEVSDQMSTTNTTNTTNTTTITTFNDAQNANETHTSLKPHNNPDSRLQLTQPNVRKLLHASNSDNFDRFINCLNQIECSPKPSRSGEFNDYSDYFAQVLQREDAEGSNDEFRSIDAELDYRRPCTALSDGGMQNGNGAGSMGEQYYSVSNITIHATPDQSHSESASRTASISSLSHSTNTNDNHDESNAHLYETGELGVPDEANDLPPEDLIRSATQSQVSQSTSSASGQFLEKLRRNTSEHKPPSPPPPQPPGHSAISSDATRIGSPRSESPVPIPTLGPFITTLLARLESLPHNCFYANLYLTSLLSGLAAYSQPLLRAILLLTPSSTPPGSSVAGDISEMYGIRRVPSASSGKNELRALNQLTCQLLHAILCAVRRQIDLFVVQYSVSSPDKFGMSFMELVADAKQYFRNSAEFSEAFAARRKESTNRASEMSQSIIDIKPHQRRSFFRRMFRRSYHKTRGNSEVEKKTSVEGEQGPPNPKSPNSPIYKEQKLVNDSNQIPPTWSRYLWLPEFGISSKSTERSKKRRTSLRLKKKSSSGEARDLQSSAQITADWPTTQRMVLCTLVFEEFCKELAALCIEHSIQC
ncbi:unnamed protein product [Calicophoron daubneyi]|uniref:FHF complex subunit HOOK-interacting protein C-terminal domain-containing protein n=1 Tax=Calicophoron daubneyi TaxID=300641 RepID=A0AAV2T418_CALDB